MAALSNDPARCEVMNLGWGPQGHGPYLVRQEGFVPGGTDFRLQRFILQKDGRWLINLAFVMLTEAEQEAQLFHDLNDVLRFLDDLSAKPLKADGKLSPEANPEEILARFEQCTRRILRGMRNCTVAPLKPE